jgi:hypothetical protein
MNIKDNTLILDLGIVKVYRRDAFRRRDNRYYVHYEDEGIPKVRRFRWSRKEAEEFARYMADCTIKEEKQNADE